MSLSPISYDKKLIFRLIPDINNIYNNPYAKLKSITGNPTITDNTFISNANHAATFKIDKRHVYYGATNSLGKFSIRIIFKTSNINSGPIGFGSYGVTIYQTAGALQYHLVSSLPSVYYINGLVDTNANTQFNNTVMQTDTWYELVWIPNWGTSFSANLLTTLYQYTSVKLVEVYNGMLSASDVLNLYNNKRFINIYNDPSEVVNISVNSGAIVNKYNNTFSMSTLTVNKYNEIVFTGGASATINYNLNGKSFTISTWLKQVNEATYIQIGNYGTSAGGFSITPNNTAGGNFVYNSANTFENLSVGTLKLNYWNHLVINYNKDTGSKRVFLNGNMITSNTTGLYTATANVINVFNQGTKKKWLKNIRVFNRQLSDAEVNEIYTSEKNRYNLQ